MWMPLIAGLVVSAQAASAGAVARPQEWQPPVLLAAPLVSADGTLSGPAVSLTADSAHFFVSAPENSCHVEISTARPARPREGWYVTARVSNPQFGAATVVIDWQRRWSGGREVTGGTQARMEVRLRSPERLSLDEIQTVAPGMPCHGRLRRLELSLLDGARNGPPTDPVSPLSAAMRVELWFIHDKPNQQRGQDIPLHVSQPFDPAGTQSMFRTAVFTSGGRSYIVDVDTHFRVVREESGRIGLWVGLRRIILDGETGARHMAGASSDTVAWVPGEVLEFELPAPGVRAGGRGGGGASGGGSVSAGRGTTTPILLQGHRFSVRVRFTPAGS